MKHTASIPFSSFLSIGAISILFVSMLFVVCEVWSVHDRNMKLQYQTTVANALLKWERQNSVRLLDSTFHLLDSYAMLVRLKVERGRILERGDSAKILSQFTTSTSNLMYKTNPIHQIVVEEFTTIDLPISFVDSLRIIKLRLHQKGHETINCIAETENLESNNTIQIRNFSRNTNDYEIELQYSINLLERRIELLQRTYGPMALCFLSFIVILLIFLKTLRNLQRERKLSEMKTDFINNMTHELKTPLSTIAVSTSMLRIPAVRNNSEQVKAKVDLIDKQNKHLNELINKLLDIGMWERDELKLDKQNVLVTGFVTELAQSFAERVRGKANFRLTNLCSNSEVVCIDRMHFVILLNNLLNNALKYSNDPIEIELIASANEHEVILEVKDNGIGISSDDQEVIFQKFFRVNQNNIHKVKGLGLGLFYANKIAIAHNGFLKVKSSIGKGSHFSVRVPKAKQQTKAHTDLRQNLEK